MSRKGLNFIQANNITGNLSCDILNARERIQTCAIEVAGPIKSADRNKPVEIQGSMKVDGPEFCFSGVVGPDYCPCMALKYQADEAFPAYSVMKVSDETDFRVKTMKSGDDDDYGVVGVSTTSSTGAGDIVKVCTGGVFKVRIQSGAVVNRGDRLKKSDTTDGVATTTESSEGVFGIALESKMGEAVIPWSGSGDFDTEEIEIEPMNNVSGICFIGSGYGHVHGEGPIDIKVELWDGAQWITVVSLSVNDEVHFNTINESFATIPTVSKIRFSSDPGQDQTFHDMNDLYFSFNCPVADLIVKACFIKSENY